MASRNVRWGTKVGRNPSPGIYYAHIFRFQHVITGAQQAELPDESGGGILADEMGMGKSLTTLVLIEQTLRHGLEWVKAGESHSDGMIVKQRCRATLVIVPSHGK